jgi:hypothetical protein
MEPITLVILLLVPSTVPVTLTVIVQVVFAAIVPFASDTLLPPAVADSVPLQPSFVTLGVLTTRPLWRASPKFRPVNPTPGFEFVITNVRVVALPFGIELTAKLFVIEGGAVTKTVSEELGPAPASADDAETVFNFDPGEVPVTLAVTVHDAPGASEPPDKLILPAVEATLPPHVLFKPAGLANPAGSVSVKLIPVCVTGLDAELESVNVTPVAVLIAI